MITRFTKITIQRVKRPHEELNEELMWLSKSLGLFSTRDKESSCFRVFIELVKAAKRGNELSSDELAYMTGVTRGTVVHHLRKLIGNGLVRVEDNKYSLREKNLELTLKKMKNDFVSAFEQVEELGKEIDKKLGL
tara:strand:- start:3092 stop:3496 length:405 start_codon:yes stop_codon:yes gene_type:complete